MRRLRDEPGGADAIDDRAHALLRAVGPLAPASAARRDGIRRALLDRARRRRKGQALRRAVGVALGGGSAAVAGASIGRHFSAPERETAPLPAQAPPAPAAPRHPKGGPPTAHEVPPAAPTPALAPAPRVAPAAPPIAKPAPPPIEASRADPPATPRSEDPFDDDPKAAASRTGDGSRAPVSLGIGDDSTPDAALVVSAIKALRIDRDAPRAARLLDDYRRFHPDGALAEEALALEIEAAAEQGDPRAITIADRYLDRFPAGRFAHFARRVRLRFERSR
jgi:hypothetical protein